MWEEMGKVKGGEGRGVLMRGRQRRRHEGNRGGKRVRSIEEEEGKWGKEGQGKRSRTRKRNRERVRMSKGGMKNEKEYRRRREEYGKKGMEA